MDGLNDARALYRAVYDNPGDDTPRLVLADFLQEANEMDPRLRLIRTQFAQEKLNQKQKWTNADLGRARALAREEQRLILEHGPRWAREDLGELLTKYKLNPEWITFHKGFADLLGADNADFGAMRLLHRMLRGEERTPSYMRGFTGPMLNEVLDGITNRDRPRHWEFVGAVVESCTSRLSAKTCALFTRFDAERINALFQAIVRTSRFSFESSENARKIARQGYDDAVDALLQAGAEPGKELFKSKQKRDNAQEHYVHIVGNAISIREGAFGREGGVEKENIDKLRLLLNYGMPVNESKSAAVHGATDRLLELPEDSLQAIPNAPELVALLREYGIKTSEELAEEQKRGRKRT